MSAEKTDALVIRQTDFSESSRVLALFTRDFGRIGVIAKGGRRLKGPFDTALDLLARCRIVFLRKSSGTLDILTEAKLLSRFTPGKQNLTSLYGGYYVAELLTALTEEYDPFPNLFDAAVATLDALAESRTPQVDVLRFELTLLRELGHLPSFEECTACGHELTEANAPFSLWVSQGGLLCSACRKDDYAKHPIDAGTLSVLQRFSDPDDRLSDRLAVTDSQQRQLRTLVTSLISHQLGRRPKMARYLQL